VGTNNNLKAINLNKFTTIIKVRITDINYGGHLANDTVLSYFHEARVRYLNELGVSEIDIGDQVSLTQTEAYVSYKGEGLLGDDLVVSVHISDFSRARFKVKYSIFKKTDNKPVAEGFVTLAAFNYQIKRPQRIPQSFKDAVEKYQSNLNE
jgi:acyl-CoA thioester hydrolase